MKKYLIAAGVILLVLLVFSWYKSCQESPKEAYWRGQYEIIKADVDAERVESLKTIESLEGEIVNKDKDILRLAQEVDVSKARIGEKSKDIEKLEIAYSDLKNDTERIDNLTKQVAQWKEKFLLSETIIANKDEIIFSLTEKYKSQLIISDKYKSLYENECKISRVLTMRLDICTKRTKGLKFGGTVKTGVALTLAAIIIYGMVSK